jgi:zinc protease
MTASLASEARRVSPPTLGPERPVAWPRRTVRTLSNGLRVVLAESHTFPKMSVELFIRSGNAVVAHRTPGLAEMRLPWCAREPSHDRAAGSRKTCGAWERS